MKKSKDYFANKGISAFHFSKNLKRIISQAKREKHHMYKHFCKTVKPFLSKKFLLSERINLTVEEKDSLLTNCEEVAKELKEFLYKCCQEFQYPKLWKSLEQNLDDPTLNHCVKSVQIRSYFWSVFGHFSRSERYC